MQPRISAHLPIAIYRDRLAITAPPAPTLGNSASRIVRRLAGAVTLAAGLLIAGCATMSPGAGADGPGSLAQRDLADGIALYDKGDYVSAIRTLLTSEGIWQGSLQTRVMAHKHIAFSHCLSNRPSPCKQSFQDLLRLKPDFELAAAEAGHPIWGAAFKQARREMAVVGSSGSDARTLARSSR